jgi:acyl-CoA thioester hydrolase
MAGPLPSRRPLEVELPFRVGTYDIDFAGVVSNIVYLRWLEDLRLKLLDEFLPLEGLIEQGCTPILVSTQIQYLRPTRLFDRPHGRMWMSAASRARWTLEAEIRVEGQVVATAVQTGAFVNLVTLRPIPLPGALMRQFAQQSGRAGE